jgi:hypothetical protein
MLCQPQRRDSLGPPRAARHDLWNYACPSEAPCPSGFGEADATAETRCDMPESRRPRKAIDVLYRRDATGQDPVR